MMALMVSQSQCPRTEGGLGLAVLGFAGLGLLGLALGGCGNGDGGASTTGPSASEVCHAAPVVQKTDAGVEFVRTPDACFEGLVDWPYAPKYVVIDGLRQAYIDEGPPNGDVVLLLHGEPSWSYLYRKMIPVLTAAGHRVIAMDHLGMGRSDKPIDLHAYSYLGHADRMLRFIQALGLSNITLFCQDWGSLIGLHVAGEHPELFARIAVGDGTLPVVPLGYQPVPPIADPETPDSTLVSPFADVPAQQVPFYDACGVVLPAPLPADFAQWAAYAMKNPSFHAAEVLEALTWFPLPPAALAAYDAPFPRREYMAGARVFPSLANDLAGKNDAAWLGLQGFTRPFLTIWSSNDPGNLGRFATQQSFLDHVPGAAGQPHTRLPESSHFVQDDQGPEIAARLVDWMAGTPRAADFPPAACGKPTPGITCLAPTSCSPTAPVCCGTIPALGAASSECTTAAACTTSFLTADKTVRFCTTSADCALEPAYAQCCTFQKNGATQHFCANSTIAAAGSGTCN
jgi:haloalkane dehalogenase